MNQNVNYIVIFMIGALVLLSSCSGPLCDCSDSGQPLPVKKVSEMDGREMVLVPAGEFIMGTDKTDPENTHQKIGTVKPLYLDQHPERKLHLDAYYIDQYEVTNKEYKQFVDATQFNEFPSNWENGIYNPEKGDHPVRLITWREAMTYCLWAHKQLPTEAQWEKAARGSDGRLYPWGNEFGKGKSNIDIQGDRQTAPVGHYKGDVSPYDVYDLAGNVMEWTQDWYRPYPGNDYHDKRFGAVLKVLRGSAYQEAGHYFLEAYRYAFHRTEANPDDYFENVGFRCASPFISGDQPSGS